MKANSMSLVILIFVFTNVFSQENAEYTFEIIKIGNQIWMNENLSVFTFRNGDTIPEARTHEEWRNAGKEGKPAWCYYNNDKSNEGKFGKLYNWYAVNDPRGLAPEGWHVANEKEWDYLGEYLGGKGIAGDKLKSTDIWIDEGHGSNISGFTAYPGGFRGNNGGFYRLGYSGYWWSADEKDSENAMIRRINHNYKLLLVFYFTKDYGYSVRCIKN
jgi:uncharacterized protein (TIGR02145 family)